MSKINLILNVNVCSFASSCWISWLVWCFCIQITNPLLVRLYYVSAVFFLHAHRLVWRMEEPPVFHEETILPPPLLLNKTEKVSNLMLLITFLENFGWW